MEEGADINVPILQKKELSLSPFLSEGGTGTWMEVSGLYTIARVMPLSALANHLQSAGLSRSGTSPFISSFHFPWPS